MSEFPPGSQTNLQDQEGPGIRDERRGALSNADLKAVEYYRRILDGEGITYVMEGQSKEGFMYKAVEALLAEHREREMRSFDARGLLDGIPVQLLDMADACADTSEGVEVFIEFMMSRRSIHVDEQQRAQAEKDFASTIEGYRTYAKIKQDRVHNRKKEEAIRVNLDLPAYVENDTKVLRERSMSSSGLNSKELYKIEGPIEGVHFNQRHGQDAFAIEETEDAVCIVVCDGTSDRKNSGLVSDSLANHIAQRGAVESIQKIVSPQSLAETMSDVSKSLIESGKSIEGGGSSTLSTVRIDKQRNIIEWASVGDSPIFIIDTDDAGNCTWQMVTEDLNVNESNYTNPDIVADLSNQETYALSVRADGTTRVPSEKNIKHGSVDYKPGRTIVIASDFMTKMLLHDPYFCFSRGEMWKHAEDDGDGRPLTQKGRDMRVQTWIDKAERNAKNFPKFWTSTTNLAQMRLNPNFVRDMSSVEIKAMLVDWMNENQRSSDDITIFSIDLDAYFNK